MVIHTEKTMHSLDLDKKESPEFEKEATVIEYLLIQFMTRQKTALSFSTIRKIILENKFLNRNQYESEYEIDSNKFTEFRFSRLENSKLFNKVDVKLHNQFDKHDGIALNERAIEIYRAVLELNLLSMVSSRYLDKRNRNIYNILNSIFMSDRTIYEYLLILCDNDIEDILEVITYMAKHYLGKDTRITTSNVKSKDIIIGNFEKQNEKYDRSVLIREDIKEMEVEKEVAEKETVEKIEETNNPKDLDVQEEEEEEVKPLFNVLSDLKAYLLRHESMDANDKMAEILTLNGDLFEMYQKIIK